MINNLTLAIAKRYVFEACNKGCRSDVTHLCDQICSDCHQSLPCIAADKCVFSSGCNKHFRSPKLFENHKKQPRGKKKEKKSICEKVRFCGLCNEQILSDRRVQKHKCFKRYCSNCRCNRETGYLCYLVPLSPEMPSSDKVLYVFYNFEITQKTKLTEAATLHVPNLVCLQQCCTLCEAEPNINKGCERCGKSHVRTCIHSFSRTIKNKLSPATMIVH
jgi:hypothetical protein